MRIGKPSFLSTPNLPQLTGYLSGMVATLNAINPTTRIDFGVGVAWVATMVENTSTFTKRLDAAWASGSGNGGLFSGSRAANTWYHCFVLQNNASGAIDFGFDTSVSGANAPSGWAARLIWSLKTDGSSNILAYTQIGDSCIWATPPLDLNSVGAISSANGTLYTVSSPFGISCIAQLSATAPGTGGQIFYISSPLTNDLAATATDGARFTLQPGVNSIAATIHLMTNTSSQIRIRQINSGVSTSAVSIITPSFLHPRGR